jgi:hypothetical protein
MNRIRFDEAVDELKTVRLDPHTTKNDEGGSFPFTDALERLLQAQKAEHERLKDEGVICPWVFNRSNRKVKGKRIMITVVTPRATTAHSASRRLHRSSICSIRQYL